MEVQGQASLEYLLFAYTVDGLLHLAVAAVAPLHGVGGRRQQLVVQEGQRLLQLGRIQFFNTVVEISPARDDRLRSHKEVLERSINGSPAFTAVFDALAAGSYTLWTEGRARAREVTVSEGEIVEVDWRTPARPDA